VKIEIRSENRIHVTLQFYEYRFSGFDKSVILMCKQGLIQLRIILM